MVLNILAKMMAEDRAHQSIAVMEAVKILFLLRDYR